jgi:hypothetical protein
MIQALLVGSAVLVVSMLLYGMTTALIVQVLLRLVPNNIRAPDFWTSVYAMLIVALLTAAGHLVQIALWAVAFLLSGEVATFDKAFYFSAENYTALGHGDIVLSERWRLLGPLEAINGLLLFGLSTAVMFAVMSRLVASRLRSPVRRRRKGARRNGTEGGRAAVASLDRHEPAIARGHSLLG